MKDPRIGDRVIVKAKRDRGEIRGRITRLVFMEDTRPRKMAAGPEDGKPDIEVIPDTWDSAADAVKRAQYPMFPRAHFAGLRFYAHQLELESVLDRLARGE